MAISNLGVLFQIGAGVKRNLVRAVKLNSRAVEEGGYVGAMVNLGVILKNGTEGVKPNPVRAVELFSRAVDDGGNVLAIFHLASLLHTGAEGVKPNPVRVVQLYSRAIEEGRDTNAMVGPGFLLQKGADGVPQNLTRSVQLYERAIEGGNTTAMLNLGTLLQNRESGLDAQPRHICEALRACCSGWRRCQSYGQARTSASIRRWWRASEPREICKALRTRYRTWRCQRYVLPWSYPGERRRRCIAGPCQIDGTV